jgi:hypothetical protein
MQHAITPADDRLTAFTLAEIVRSTVRPRETESERADRAAAIEAMYEGYAPRDAFESMMAAQIIGLRFLVADAMADLSRRAEAGDALREAQQAVTTLDRSLMSWVKLFDQRRAREAKERAQSAKVQAQAAQTATPTAHAEPATPSHPAAAPAPVATDPAQRRPPSVPSGNAPRGAAPTHVAPEQKSSPAGTPVPGRPNGGIDAGSAGGIRTDQHAPGPRPTV